MREGKKVGRWVRPGLQVVLLDKKKQTTFFYTFKAVILELS